MTLRSHQRPRLRRPGRTAAAVVGTSAAVASTAAAAGTAFWLRDGGRRERLRRSARVWRLTARRATHWAVVRVRGAGADEEARARLEEQFAIRSAEDVARELGNMKGAIMKSPVPRLEPRAGGRGIDRPGPPGRHP